MPVNANCTVGASGARAAGVSGGEGEEEGGQGEGAEAAAAEAEAANARTQRLVVGAWLAAREACALLAALVKQVPQWVRVRVRQTGAADL
jgi:hypothetical protein